jgi:hypothetical protein
MTRLHSIAAALLVAAQLLLAGAAVAHEGHDDDAPPPLNLPVAPRVVAVTPDYELGVLSGEHRLTIFLHRFETGEPVKDAKVFVSDGEQEVEAAQRMADGSLFVPKATQHLLSVRTVLTAETKAPRTVELSGTIIADPNSFGRVQAGHAGRIEAPDGGLAFVGKRVRKGDLLAQLQHHIEAYDKGNMQGEIAELEERIKLQEAKLARYLQARLKRRPRCKRPLHRLGEIGGRALRAAHCALRAP